jgi:hypothetical protein
MIKSVSYSVLSKWLNLLEFPVFQVCKAVLHAPFQTCDIKQKNNNFILSHGFSESKILEGLGWVVLALATDAVTVRWGFGDSPWGSLHRVCLGSLTTWRPQGTSTA